MKKLKMITNLFRINKESKSQLQDFKKQQLKFRKKYPLYEIGVGTYGFPLVHDDDEGYTLRLGSFCSIASGVQIFLGMNHRTDWITTYPFPAFFDAASHIKKSSISKGNVTIGSDVWLCANCTILSGVNIGHGAVVGAGAVVTKDIEPYAIVAGNPAKMVRWRFDCKTRETLLGIAWWNWPLHELIRITDVLCSNNVEHLLAYAKNR